MKSPIINRYVILQNLGKGSMGSVFLVEDILENNKKIALKTIHETLLTEHSLNIFIKEFDVMSRLKHPYLIRVFDFSYDPIQKTHFITMEYVPGKTLEEELQKIGKCSLTKAVEIFTQLCHGIDFIHSRGILHRDINPKNILISKDTTKLMDFGLADLGSETEKIKGTPAYMAPEVLSNSNNSTTDIFALGLTFYEMITGQRFINNKNIGDVIEIIRNKKNFEKHKKNALSILDEPGVKKIIERMVAYESKNRFQSCSSALIGLSQELHRPVPVESDASKQAYVLGASFVGRKKEFAFLTDRINNGSDHTMYWVKGESGVGKTRLFNEIKQYCQIHNTLFLYGQCQENIKPIFAPFAPVLNECVVKIDDDQIRQMGPELKKIIPGHTRLQSIPIAPIHENPQEEKVCLINTVISLLFALSHQNSPKVVVFLDDMQWSDELSLEALEIMLKRFSDTKNTSRFPLVYIASQLEVNERIEKIFQQPKLSIIQLHPFEKHDVVGYIHAIFGKDRIDTKLKNSIPAINKNAKGNPLFLQEFIKIMIENEIIIRRGSMWELTKSIDEVDIPKNIESFIRHRIDTMNVSRKQKQVMEVFAAMNRKISWEELQQIVPVEFSFLEKLEHVELIKAEKTAEAIFYSFNYGITSAILLQQVKYKEKLFLSVAKKIEKIHFDEIQRYVDELAYYYNNTGCRNKAMYFLLQSAQKAELHFETHKAKNQYQKYVIRFEEKELTNHEVEHQYSIYERIGYNCYILGNWKERARVIEKMIILAQNLQDKEKIARSTFVYGIVKSYNGDKEGDAISYFEKSYDLFMRLNDRASASNSLNQIGFQYYRFEKNYKKAIEYCTEGLNLAKEGKSNRHISFCQTNLAYVYHEIGDFERAISLAQGAIDLIIETKRREDVAECYNLLGTIYTSKRDFETALLFFDKSISFSQENGTFLFEGDAYIGKAKTYVELHEIEKAKKMCQLGLERIENISHFTARYEGHLCSAKIMVLSGDCEGGKQKLLELLDNNDNIFQCAEIYYELWLISQDNDYKQGALKQYELIVPKVKHFQYIQRLEKLRTNNSTSPLYTHHEQQSSHSAAVCKSPDSKSTMDTHTPHDTMALIEGVTNNPLVWEILGFIRDLNSNLDLSQLLKKILDACIYYLQAERGAVMTYNAKGVLEVRAVRNSQKENLDKNNVNISKTVVNKVLTNGEPLFVTDVAEDDEFSVIQSVMNLRLRSVMCTPLNLKLDKKHSDLYKLEANGRFGLIYLDSKHVSNSDELIDRKLLLFRTLADQASVAFGNAMLTENLHELNEKLEEKVKQRTADLEKAHRKMVEDAHKTGMAEIAISVLHNIGNVLNSVTVSSNLISDVLRNSNIKGLLKANDLLKSNMDNLSGFIMEDGKGKKLLEYYLALGNLMDFEKKSLVEHSDRLEEKINAIKEIMISQQSYASVNNSVEEIVLDEVLDDSLKILENTLIENDIMVQKGYSKSIRVSGSKIKMMNAFINIIQNAEDAMVETSKDSRNLAIAITELEGEAIVDITDSGCGIKKEHINNIFTMGYSTKQKGHGFGLHSCAIDMKSMGGRVSVHSEGKNKGTKFTLVFPKIKS